MPYDPDWDLEDETGINLNALGAAAEDKISPFEYDSNEMYEEEGEQHADYEQGPEDAEAEDQTAAELPVSLPRPDQKQFLEQPRDTTPRNRQPFPGASARRLPKVEVVLQSSPRRLPFTAPADELAGNFSDEPNLITSDIVPNPVNNQQPAAKTQVNPPKMQPPVASAPVKLPDITPQPKKRGRPVGWRRGHGSYAAMRSGLPPGSATPRPKPKPADEHKVRRRPGRKPAPTARQVYLKLNPHFIAFRCEWEGCPAELQNIETLRKHLLLVHGRPSRSPPRLPSPSPTAQRTTTALPCKWASCKSAPLPSRESFASHIEAAHLLPFRWHVGDGPRNTTPPSSQNPVTNNNRNHNRNHNRHHDHSNHHHRQQQHQQQTPPPHVPLQRPRRTSDALRGRPADRERGRPQAAAGAGQPRAGAARPARAGGARVRRARARDHRRGAGREAGAAAHAEGVCGTGVSRGVGAL
ncbi:uncharacterized protein B0H64DRAFT_392671, partial [Chaetomium fimeti]